MTADLSVIIVNWNTRQILSRCLKSVTVNLNNLDTEIFVVDNGSTDGSVEMVSKEFPQVSLIVNQENAGFAKANNQAIRVCNGKYILLLNSDAFLTQNAIQRMLQMMDSDSSIGIAGACLEYPNGQSQVSHGPLPDFWSEARSLFGLDKLSKPKVYKDEYIETGTVSGACMLVRKSLLNDIGLLDEDYFMFNEEVDLCNRCHKAGIKVIFVPSARVIHAEAGSTGQTVQRITRLYSGKLLYFYKHFGPQAELRLQRVMMISANLKGIAYRLLRIISLGRINKDEFWRAISKELSTTYR